MFLVLNSDLKSFELALQSLSVARPTFFKPKQISIKGVKYIYLWFAIVYICVEMWYFVSRKETSKIAGNERTTNLGYGIHVLTIKTPIQYVIHGQLVFSRRRFVLSARNWPTHWSNRPLIKTIIDFPDNTVKVKLLWGSIIYFLRKVVSCVCTDSNSKSDNSHVIYL